MDQVTVFTSDGVEKRFDIGDLNLSREQLLITLKIPNGTAGWHWDQLVCVLQPAQPPLAPSARQCELALVLPDGQRKSLTLDGFHSAGSAMCNSLIIIRGAQQTAFINRDFLYWYRVR